MDFIILLKTFHLSEKVADLITFLAEAIGIVVYAFVAGWKLTLVYLSFAPVTILMFNITIQVSRENEKHKILCTNIIGIQITLKFWIYTRQTWYVENSMQAFGIFRISNLIVVFNAVIQINWIFYRLYLWPRLTVLLRWLDN